MSIYTMTSTIHEYDTVELLVDLPDARMEFPEEGDAPLHAGDRGVVVSAYDEDQSVTVEFFRDGETVSIAEVRREQVRRAEQPPDEDTGAHVDFAFLADTARFLPNRPGRFNVVGAGIWGATIPKTPGTYPKLTLVIGFGYERHGLDRDHEVVVTFRHPDDPAKQVGPVTGGDWAPVRQIIRPSHARGMEPEGVGDVLHVPYVTPKFSDYGRYEFRITIDGREAKIVYFTLMRPRS